MLLYLHGGLGLAGWQWLFIIEAVPAIILAGVVFFYLTDWPADAAWLAPDERNWLAGRLELERRQRQAVRDFSVRQSLVNPRVLGLSLVYFGAVATNYGLSFFLPQIVKAFGLNTLLTTLVSATPYAVGLIGMVWWGRRSDHVVERRYHAAFPLFIAAAEIAVSTALDNPTLKMISLCVAGFGIFANLPVFWTLPTAFLSGAAAAAGIAVINSIGNLAGFAGPFAMGGSRTRPAAMLAACCCWRRLASLRWDPADARPRRSPTTPRSRVNAINLTGPSGRLVFQAEVYG